MTREIFLRVDDVTPVSLITDALAVFPQELLHGVTSSLMEDGIHLRVSEKAKGWETEGEVLRNLVVLIEAFIHPYFIKTTQFGDHTDITFQRTS